MIRSAGGIKRFHTVPTIGVQTVAEHSYHVAMLCIELSSGKPSTNLLKAALYHDLAELVTGDIPAPVKWANPNLKNELENIEENCIDISLTPNERSILRHADAFECAFYAVDQIMLGNKNMIQVYKNITTHIGSMKVLDNPTPYDIIINNLIESYVNATK
jgi:hypothetical protein